MFLLSGKINTFNLSNNVMISNSTTPAELMGPVTPAKLRNLSVFAAGFGQILCDVEHHVFLS